MKFNYQIRTKDGQLQTGVVEAPSQEAALGMLQNYGVYITYLEAEKTTFFSKKLPFFQGVAGRDMVIFTRQLSILFKSSVPMVESLHTLAAQAKKGNLKDMILDVTKKIEEGTPLSQAMTAYPQIFSPFYIGVVQSGEASGKLAEVLEYLADHMEREHNFKSKVVMAMVYPLFVVAVFILVIVMMIVFVIPQLSQVLKESGQELPWMTKMVISFSDFFRAQWVAMLLVFVGSVFFLVRFIRSPEGKKLLDQVSLKVPLIGEFLKKIYLSRLAENLSTLISSGLPIIQALEITGNVLGNATYMRVVSEVREEIKKGETISATLSRYPALFPPLFTQMVIVGEKTGKLDNSLLNIVNFYQKDVERALETLIGLLEPIMIIGLGIMVLGLMGSVLLPIYQMGMQ